MLCGLDELFEDLALVGGSLFFFCKFLFLDVDNEIIYTVLDFRGDCYIFLGLARDCKLDNVRSVLFFVKVNRQGNLASSHFRVLYEALALDERVKECVDNIVHVFHDFIPLETLRVSFRRY